VNCTGR